MSRCKSAWKLKGVGCLAFCLTLTLTSNHLMCRSAASLGARLHNWGVTNGESGVTSESPPKSDHLQENVSPSILGISPWKIGENIRKIIVIIFVYILLYFSWFWRDKNQFFLHLIFYKFSIFISSRAIWHHVFNLTLFDDNIYNRVRYFFLLRYPDI